MINQILAFITEDKGNIIAQTWVNNLDEHCQGKGTKNIDPEVETLQLKDGKGRKGNEKEEEDSESGNLSDCVYDQAVGVHKNTIEGKVTRKQRKAIVKNVEVEEDNLDNCNRGNNNMNKNNEAAYVPCMMNKKILQNEHIDSKGIKLSTHSKKAPISTSKDFLWEI
jgi:hypothetical protein